MVICDYCGEEITHGLRDDPEKACKIGLYRIEVFKAVSLDVPEREERLNFHRDCMKTASANLGNFILTMKTVAAKKSAARMGFVKKSYRKKTTKTKSRRTKRR